VLSVNVIDRIGHVLQLNDIPDDILERVLAGLNVKHGSGQLSQRINFLLYLVEVVLEVNSFSDWEVHLF